MSRNHKPYKTPFPLRKLCTMILCIGSELLSKLATSTFLIPVTIFDIFNMLHMLLFVLIVYLFISFNKFSFFFEWVLLCCNFVLGFCRDSFSSLYQHLCTVFIDTSVPSNYFVCNVLFFTSSILINIFFTSYTLLAKNSASLSWLIL